MCIFYGAVNEQIVFLITKVKINNKILGKPIAKEGLKKIQSKAITKKYLGEPYEQN
ncbi:MAG: hypothetical protein ACOXZ2_03855 [Sphaerochaetaceae bacterium]